MKPAGLGILETDVMLAIHSLGNDAYGVTIKKTIEEMRGGKVSFGAIYATLDRIEGKGFIESRFSDSTPERGGRSKRMITLLSPGMVALKETISISRQRVNFLPAFQR